MPLNRVIGEPLEGLDSPFVVVSATPFKNMTELTTIVMEPNGKSFYTEEKPVRRSMFEAALSYAQLAFWRAGADPSYLRYELTCQIYPDKNLLIFLFCAEINGQEQLFPAPFELSRDQIAYLADRGLGPAMGTMH
jgi:hypothetical protein